MRRELTNELEERRVVRLVESAAAAIAPLADAEVETIARRATARPDGQRARSRHRQHVFSAATLAAAAALAVSLPVSLRLEGDPPEPAGTAGATRGVVAFPEGSALQLLLSRRAGEHA